MSKGNVLIIDDENTLRDILSRVLELEGYKVYQAETAAAGQEILSREEISIIISDVKLPDANGIDLTLQIKSLYPLCEVIVLTAYGTIQDGVQAIKNGAFDYITKGDEDNKILPLVEKAFDKVQLRRRIIQLEEQISEIYNFSNIHGNSPLLLEAIDQARKVSQTDAPVLLQGETGTGKEIFAHAIHNSGNRKNKPFIAVNCSAFARELLESEMFGYKSGAFTGASKNKKGLFEEANEGTLFLDEIGEMDTSLQAKLLRIIESNSFIKQGDTKQTIVDVRIIAATNRNLEEEIKKGTFRKDLYYRISVIKIEIPPLRMHKEDIPVLTEEIVKEYSAKLNRNITGISPEFLEGLYKYDYPGNIRELKNIIERAIILSDNNVLTAKYLPRDLTNNSEPKGEEKEILLLEEIEKQHILRILNIVNGNKTRAAEMMGIGLTTLYRKLQSYGME